MELRFQDPAFHNKELTLKFLASGKVVAKVGNGRSHYTLHPGTASRCDRPPQNERILSGGRSREARKAMGFAPRYLD